MISKSTTTAELRAQDIIVLRSLDSKGLDFLSAHATVADVPARRTIVEEGSHAQRATIVLSGSVKVYHVASDGREIAVKILKAPVMFGEVPIVAKASFGESVATIEPCRLLHIPGTAFLALIERDHSFARAVLEHVCHCFRIAADTESALAFAGVRARLAQFLLGYVDMDGCEAPGGNRTRIPITQNDMANFIGATRRAIAKELARWQESDAIARVKGHYVILDPGQLREDIDEPRNGIFYSFPPGKRSS